MNDGDWKRLASIVENVTTMRAELFRQLMDPRRNIDDECGYPGGFMGSGIGSVSPELYRYLYEREAIASRVVELMPRECFAVFPEITDAEDGKETEFTGAVKELGQGLDQGLDWYDSDVGSAMHDLMLRADIACGIGHFGLILLGIDDGKELSEPAEGVVSYEPGKQLAKNASWRSPDTWNVKDQRHASWNFDISKFDYRGGMYGGAQLGVPEYPATKPAKYGRKLLYAKVFDEALVQITNYEANPYNPRFGQPLMYNITLNDPRDQHGGIGLSSSTVRVHWSRVIHVADEVRMGTVFGTPRLRAVLNRVLDIRKVCAASAEGYWKSCFTGIALTTHPQLGGDVKINAAQLKDQLENYQHGLQRFLILMGMQANTLPPNVIDPKAFIDTQIEAIAIQKGCPLRVLKGAERGELASTQDDSDWNGRVAGRQNGHLTPNLARPLYNRLISVGVLPVPQGKKWRCRWPDLDSLSSLDKATLFSTQMSGFATYLQGNVNQIIPEEYCFTEFAKLDKDKAEEMLKAAAKAQEEREAEEAILAEEQGMSPAPPPGYKDPEPEPPFAKAKEPAEPAPTQNVEYGPEFIQHLERILEGNGDA